MHNEHTQRIQTVEQRKLALIKKDLEIGHARIAKGSMRNDFPKMA